ncbi:fimbrial protein [Salmonella enterica subsp. diarizonae serovar 48:i:z]|uniref:fimbrial protein n=1 Tax=Salmonella enterica TaxID=28901 RepID=UPI000EF6786C|nr:fimbrial protein [Salmonella enterica]RLR21922.1 fimbrial protein [Salmonella enterica subsp. diarizonae serovar 48:i:z]RLR22304.1 fimbrial protein [Salmonella enterica subsp. diarizonae serovar 48:i:z]
MNKINFFLLVSILLKLNSGFAATTVTSEFEITNRVIDRSSITSTDNTMTYTDDGNGLYKIHDNFKDANIPNLRIFGNQQSGFTRDNSLIKITMTGQKLGHKFIVNAKYANSEIRAFSYVNGYFSTYKNKGCTDVQPSTKLINGVKFVDYKITSNSNVNMDCAASTIDVDWAFWLYPVQTIRVEGVSRDVYLDIGSLNKSKQYRDVPPDIYTGKSSYNGEVIKNRVGDGYRVYYYNNIKIIKNPYFENVTLPAGDNIFDVKTIGNDINGNLVIPYVINGHFTPYNRVVLNVLSLNGFKLKDPISNNSIPYSLSTNIGGQKKYSLANSGVGTGTVTISNLANESYALQGKFDADFTIDKSTAVIGDYTDELTAIFQIEL